MTLPALSRVPGPRLPAHEATTAQLGVAYPFAASLPLPVDRVLVGRDLAGGPFFHDPFELYAAGVVTNPNMTVIGQIGRGKSALLKSYLLRQRAFGRRIAVLDPKGEYGPLARALGTEPIKLSPRGGTRVNPLDGFRHDSGTGPFGQGCTVGAGVGLRAGEQVLRRQRLTLLAALAEATMRRRLEPAERLALELALDACSGWSVTAGAHVRRGDASRGDGPCSPTLADVVDTLLSPPAASARAAGVSATTLASEGRDVALELRRLVMGDLAGMFDGETSAAATKSEDVLVVDLSDVYHSEALPAIMVCAAAWLQAMTAVPGTSQAAECSSPPPAPFAQGSPVKVPGAHSKTVFVVDEAWAVLSDVAVGRYLRSSWKLARARGLANVAVCHRASDLAAAGAAGSEQARLAEGLLADSETVVCYSQPASELTALAGLLGCSPGELEYLPRLGRGVALWRVGDGRFLVEHMLSAGERRITDTDGRLRTGPA